jgi:perosamine synthetase
MIRVSQALTGPEERAALDAALARNYFGHAELVVEFEKELAKWLGRPPEAVVCVANGTAALHLALLAAGVGPGDEVIVPSLTFIASFQAVAMTGARAVACDVSLETMLMEPSHLAAQRTARTKAVMCVHYGGDSCDLAALSDAAGPDVRIVEDAAHAFGSSTAHGKVGAAGDLVCFSFDSIKNITCGEGGAVVCASEEDAARVRTARHLGMRNRDSGVAPMTVDAPGFRYHMSNLNAAFGLAQLPKANQFIARRREICASYDAAFTGLAGITVPPRDWNAVAPHIYVVRVLNGHRDAFRAALDQQGIQTGFNYPPNHRHQYFRSGATLANTDRLAAELVTLPLHCAMTDVDVEQVCAAVQAFDAQHAAGASR